MIPSPNILDFRKAIEENINAKKAGKPLTYQDRNVWSEFVEKNRKPGQGFEEIWTSFVSKNPNTQIDKNVLQGELEELKRRFVNEAIKTGTGGEATHTGLMFPKMMHETKAGQYVDYGRINAKGETEKPIPVGEQGPPVPKRFLKARFPKDIDPSTLVNDRGYPSWADPKTGDIVWGESGLLQTPEYRKLNPKKENNK